MAGPSLGSLLIQRLDAALGIALSRQGQIVQRSGPEAVYPPGQPQELHTDPDALPDPRARAGQKGARGAGGTPAAPDRPLPPSATGPHTVRLPSATITLGPVARIILDLVANQPGPAPALTARTPLLSTPPPAAQPPSVQTLLPGHLAQQLARRLQHSGLFYESHLKTLGEGRLEASALRREPQALLNASARPAPATPATPTAGIHPASHTLIHQQLDALADQAVHWRGELWPGAPLEWRIERRREDTHDPSAHAQETDGANWASHLRLHLPRLGVIDADLRLDAIQLQIALSADAQRVATLQAQTPRLRERLLAAGLPLSSLSIEATEEPAHDATAR